MVHQRLGVQLSEVPAEELEIHFHYFCTTRDPGVRKNESKRLFDAYLVANKAKSSCATLEVVSLDWISLGARSLGFSI